MRYPDHLGYKGIKGVFAKMTTDDKGTESQMTSGKCELGARVVGIAHVVKGREYKRIEPTQRGGVRLFIRTRRHIVGYGIVGYTDV